MKTSNGYEVVSFIVTLDNSGKRSERRLEDIPAEELKEIGKRMNARALRAAGYKEVVSA